jgi:MFS family permease
VAGPDPLKSTDSLYKNLDKTTVDFTASEALHTRALWLLVAYTALTFLVITGFMTIQVDYLFDIGVPPTRAARLLMVLGAAMGISQLGVGFLGLRVKMRSLAIFSMVLSIIGFSILQFAHSLPLVLAFFVLYGMGQGMQSVAMGNLLPDYFGRTEFPKIMGFTSPITTFVSSIGAPLMGYIRDSSGSYLPAFRILLVLLILSFFCVVFAKRPVHYSLREGQA